jgi:hypothetical protein
VAWIDYIHKWERMKPSGLPFLASLAYHPNHALVELAYSIRPSRLHLEPCLPSPADKPPSGANWIDEIKHDGRRKRTKDDEVGKSTGRAV